MNDFELLRTANRTRQLIWPGSEQVDTLFRAVEFGEEAGEVLGAVKKYVRAKKKIAGNTDNSITVRREALMDEIGDAVITLDLLADQLSIDIRDCVARKFNKTSEKNGLPVRMDMTTWKIVDSSDPQLF